LRAKYLPLLALAAAGSRTAVAATLAAIVLAACVGSIIYFQFDPKATAVSIVLAILSYRYVQQPFRRKRWGAPRAVSAGLACIMIIFCASMYVDSADGLPRRLPPQAQAMRSLEVMWEWPCQSADRRYSRLILRVRIALADGTTQDDDLGRQPWTTFCADF
jgi:hypothetical protein